jgi:murein DD-endopeptidase MepM/ murein hydrolase activator NlpD
MVAGAFVPKRGKPKGGTRPGDPKGTVAPPTYFGKTRDPNARGKMVSGWEHGINVWVDCRAYIYGYDGNTYDITDDIITGTLTRNTDAPTTMNITFANEGDKYRQMFIPNDRIVLFLRRNEVEWQAFTGYIHNTPVFNLYDSRELSLECSCIIRRLNQKFWDANLRENILVLSGGSFDATGLGTEGEEEEDPAEGQPEEGQPEEEDNVVAFSENAPITDGNTPGGNVPEDEDAPDGGDPSLGAGGMITPDMTLAFLLTAPDHIGLKPEMVYIQKFPDVWRERAASITASNQPCMRDWAQMIVCPEDNDCEDGGSSGEGGGEGTGDWDGSGNVDSWITDGFKLGGVFDDSPSNHSAMKSRIMQESGGDPKAINNWDCVDMETRIVTRRGLLEFDEVEIGDETIGLNPETKEEEWTVIRDVYKHENARTVDVDFGAWSVRVTPRHTWVLSDGTLEKTNDLRLDSHIMLGDGDLFPVKDLVLTIDKPQDVWCVTTDLGSWTAQKKDIEFLTGNSNAAAGTPSKGLVQIIEPTWESHRKNPSPDVGSFDQNWDNPIKSVAVSSRYMKAQYGHVVGANGSGYVMINEDKSLDPSVPQNLELNGQRINSANAGQNVDGTLGVEGGKVCCEYGGGCSIAQSPHAGVDVCASTGAGIHAWGDGQIIAAGPASGYNQYVTIQYAPNVSVLYGHIGQGTFKSSGSVSKNEIIAKVGTSADAMGTPPHAHIQAFPSASAAKSFDNGNTIDPVKAFQQISGQSGTGEAGDFNPETANCGTGSGSDSGQEGGQTGSGEAPLGWHLVDTDKMEMRVNVQTRHGASVDHAIRAWDLGAIKIIKTSDNPTVTVVDGQVEAGAGATTSSDGKITLGPAYDRSTDNAKNAMSTHEVGHALGFDHKFQPPNSSVMQNVTTNASNNVDSPTSYDKDLYADVWGTGGGIRDSGNGSGSSDVHIARDTIQFFHNVAAHALRAPYRWGGGHDERLTVKGIKNRGVDATGLFNAMRRLKGLEPWDVGGTVDYFKFLDNVQEFDPKRKYPRGTVLIHPGSENIQGHMAMVYDHEGHVIEANGRKGIIDHFTIEESNSNWYGYTHVGEMPDVPIDIPPVELKPSQNMFANVEENNVLKDLISKAQGMVGPAYKFGGGHAGETYEQAKTQGVDCSGLFNVLFRELNLANSDIGPTSSWGSAVRGENFDVNKKYPAGTFVINPGTGANGHMAMIIDDAQNLLQSYHPKGVDLNMPVKTSQPHANYTIAGEHPALGTMEGMPDQSGGGDSGSGDDGTQTASVEVEPCITRHPLGVYKLAMTAMAEMAGESTVLAEAKRQLALNNGDMETTRTYMEDNFEIDAWYKFPELWEACEEERDFEHLAELDKESYMPTVQDVADAGMYTMMSIGTGEIVFWYPWIIGEISDSVAEGAEEKRKKDLPISPEELDELYKKYPKLRAYELSSYTMQQIIAMFPELSKAKKPKEEIDEQKDISGLPLSRTNVSVLTDKFILRDQDLIDFSLYVSDDPLVTHYFVMGEYRLQNGNYGGIPDLQCWRWSTIFDNPLMVKQKNESPNFDPNLFIQRYGVRSKSEHVPAIKIPGMAQIWAEQQFIRHWLNCYLIQLQTAFLPELYPGTRLEIAPLGIEVVVLQVSHSFGSQWSTNLTVSQPLLITDKTAIPPLPFWTLFNQQMVDEGLDPLRPIEGLQSGDQMIPDSIPIDQAPLGEGSDLWESINEKRAADNERVKNYLEYWAYLRDHPDFYRRTLEFMRENPGIALPPAPFDPKEERPTPRDKIPKPPPGGGIGIPGLPEDDDGNVVLPFGE